MKKKPAALSLNCTICGGEARTHPASTARLQVQEEEEIRALALALLQSMPQGATVAPRFVDALLYLCACTAKAQGIARSQLAMALVEAIDREWN